MKDMVLTDWDIRQPCYDVLGAQSPHLEGLIVNHPHFRDGTRFQTSCISNIWIVQHPTDPRQGYCMAETRNGTKYRLEEPCRRLLDKDREAVIRLIKEGAWKSLREDVFCE